MAEPAFQTKIELRDLGSKHNQPHLKKQAYRCSAKHANKVPRQDKRKNKSISTSLEMCPSKAGTFWNISGIKRCENYRPIILSKFDQ